MFRNEFHRAACWLVAGWLAVMASLPLLAQMGPATQWAVTGGGAGSETVASVATDEAGNVYAAGTFTNTATFGVSSLTSAGGADIFLAKYATNGALIWLRRFGGMGNEAVRSIIASPTGDVFCVGSFEGTVTFGITNLVSAGGTDAFVARVDSQGNVVWATSAGGTGQDRAVGIYGTTTLITVVGEFSGTATFFGATGGTNLVLTSAGGQDVFGWAVREAQGEFYSAISIGGAGHETAATASSSADTFPVVLGGSFTGTVLLTNTSLQIITLASDGGTDGFAASWSPFGPRILSATKIGGPDDDEVQATILNLGRPTLSGRFGSRATCYYESGGIVRPGPLTFTNSNPSGSDVFFVSYSGFLGFSSVINVNAVSGPGDESVTGLAVDNQGQSYLVGTFSSSIVAGSIPITGTGQQGIFLVKFGQFGLTRWARAISGTGNESSPSVGVYYRGLDTPVLIAGVYENSVTLGSVVLNAVGGSDIFVASIDPDPRIVTQPQPVSVPSGGTASLSVVAGGTGPFTYQWFRTFSAVGTNPPVTVTLTNQTSSSLIYSNFTSAEVGTYFVRVTGAFGSVYSSSATVSLPPSFSITTQPLAQAVPVGANLTLSVAATGPAPLTYQWYHTVSAIPDATNATLTLTNAQTANSGSYFALVSDGSITVISSNVFVRVFTPFALSVPRFTNNSSFYFSLGGDNGLYYRLEFSTNLTTWTPLATNLASAGTAAFSDNAVLNQRGRFYRVTLLP